MVKYHIPLNKRHICMVYCTNFLELNVCSDVKNMDSYGKVSHALNEA